jgi:hypothetical protein
MSEVRGMWLQVIWFEVKDLNNFATDASYSYVNIVCKIICTLKSRRTGLVLTLAR